MEFGIGWFDGVKRSTAGTRPIAESGAEHGNAVSVRPPLDAVELGGERDKKIVARFGDAAADDNGLGIERVDERGDAGGEVADGFVPNLRGVVVAGFHGGDEIGGRVKRRRCVAPSEWFPTASSRLPGVSKMVERTVGDRWRGGRDGRRGRLAAEQPAV